MDNRWTSHLRDKEDKTRFQNYLKGNKALFERLSDILKEMDTQQDVGETTADVYDSPSWAFKQADSNGYRRCLRHLQKLTTLDQRKENG